MSIQLFISRRWKEVRNDKNLQFGNNAMAENNKNSLVDTTAGTNTTGQPSYYLVPCARSAQTTR